MIHRKKAKKLSGKSKSKKLSGNNKQKGGFIGTLIGVLGALAPFLATPVSNALNKVVDWVHGKLTGNGLRGGAKNVSVNSVLSKLPLTIPHDEALKIVKQKLGNIKSVKVPLPVKEKQFGSAKKQKHDVNPPNVYGTTETLSMLTSTQPVNNAPKPLYLKPLEQTANPPTRCRPYAALPMYNTHFLH